MNAINWCMHNSVDIINISLGTTNNFAFPSIKSAIDNVLKKGIIVIAAMDNKNRYSLPACLYGVIGVKASQKYMNDKFKLKWYPFDGIEIAVSGRHQIDIKGMNVLVTNNKNSFATPVITAYIANIFNVYGNKSYDELLFILEQMAAFVKGKHILSYYPYFWQCINSHKPENWNKAQYSMVVNPYIKHCKTEIEVPVISISGENDRAQFEFMQILVKKMRNQYNYLVLSDDVLECDNNIIFPSYIDRHEFISCVYELYRPDILLIDIAKGIEADIRVIISTDICFVYEDIYDKVICERGPLHAAGIVADIMIGLLV